MVVYFGSVRKDVYYWIEMGLIGDDFLESLGVGSGVDCGLEEL